MNKERLKTLQIGLTRFDNIIELQQELKEMIKAVLYIDLDTRELVFSCMDQEAIHNIVKLIDSHSEATRRLSTKLLLEFVYNSEKN